MKIGIENRPDVFEHFSFSVILTVFQQSAPSSHVELCKETAVPFDMIDNNPIKTFSSNVDMSWICAIGTHSQSVNQPLWYRLIYLSCLLGPVKYSTDSHVPLRVKFSNFHDPLTLHQTCRKYSHFTCVFGSPHHK